MPRRTGRAATTDARRAAFLAAAAVVAALVAGCTGSSPNSPSSVPVPPDQRLTFIWTEAVPVPAEQRAAVDTARDWQRAYQLTVTEPSSVAPFLAERSSPTLIDEIRRAMAGAPAAGGTVRITLIEVTSADGTVHVGLCEDKRAFGVLVNGQPQPIAGEVRARRLDLTPSPGGWMVQRLQFQAPDLDARCAALPTASTAAG